MRPEPVYMVRENSAVGRNIARLRAARHMTQEELAERAGLSSVKMLETGARTGRVPTLRAVAKALAVPLSTILDEGQAARSAVLAEFLESPLGKCTAEEERQLAAIVPKDCTPTIEAYHLMLLALRACRR